MTHRQANPEQVKLKKQQRNQRYHVNLAITKRNRENNTLYQREKREQTRLTQHQDSLNQLMNIMTQQQYLERVNDRIDEILIIESMKKEEIIDMNDMMEYDEGLGDFNDDYENEEFSDEIES